MTRASRILSKADRDGTTRHIAPSRVAPSIRAACSSSSGIESTNPRMTQIASGTLKAK